jgi:NAD(P)H dehydrogenase (quinone)
VFNIFIDPQNTHILYTTFFIVFIASVKEHNYILFKVNGFFGIKINSFEIKVSSFEIKVNSERGRRMKVTVILCHPVRGSFNHAIADEVVRILEQQKHTVHYHDLYDEGFQPVLTADELQRRFSFDEKVQMYTSSVLDSEGLVFVHPDWWGGPPALLKGWLDRVFRPGVAYDFEGEDFMKKQKAPLLTDKKGLVFCTTDSNEKKHTSLLRDFWIEAVFKFCGVEDTGFHIFDDLHNKTYTQRK